MVKYKATITCNAQTWEKFKNTCMKQGSNASAKIEEFMEAYLKNKKPIETVNSSYIKETIEKEVEERLDKEFYKAVEDYKRIIQQELKTEVTRIEKTLNNKLLSLGQKYLTNLKQNNETRSNTNDTDNTDKKIKGDFAQDTDNTDNTNKKIKDDFAQDTDNTDNTDRLSGIQNESKIYSDDQVAEIEGLSSVTINRYKTGRRKPQDKTFFERWKKIKTEKGFKWKKKNKPV